MLKLYNYFRSSSSYRVRIALNLKDVPYESIAINLLENQQRSDEFLKLNPQGLLPVLVGDDFVLPQSLAIIDYLDEVYPDPPLLPADPIERARARSLAHMIALDTHPLNNLRVLRYLTDNLHIDQEQKQHWYQQWIYQCFDVFEKTCKKQQAKYSFSNQISLVDICLIPQVYNALRFDCDMSSYPLIMQIYNACINVSAFKAAQPENQNQKVI